REIVLNDRHQSALSRTLGVRNTPRAIFGTVDALARGRSAIRMAPRSPAAQAATAIGGGGGAQHITINVSGANKSPERIGYEVARQLQRHPARKVVQRRGTMPGVGLG